MLFIFKTKLIPAVALLVTLWLAVLLPSRALACAGACAVDADCSANPCRYCDTDFGVCSDCCEFTEAITCPSACTFQYGECRNVSGTSCGIALPETPRSYRIFIFLGLALLALTVYFWKFIRPKARPS